VLIGQQATILMPTAEQLAHHEISGKMEWLPSIGHLLLKGWLAGALAITANL
jgi:hypothetical protein